MSSTQVDASSDEEVLVRFNRGRCVVCGEGKLVSRVHTLVGRSAQVVYELQVLEEAVKVREEVQKNRKGESR